MVVLQLCSSYIHYYGKPDNVYFSLNHEPLLVSLGISNSLILYICTCIFTSIYKLHFPRACRHDEIELVILLTSVISALNMNSLSIHANFSIGHRKLLYDFSYFNYNFFSLCSLLKMLYNREYCPTFRQMDKAGERTIKKNHKPLNYFLCEMILLVSNNSSLYILSFLQIQV